MPSHHPADPSPLGLPHRLQAILDQPFGRFSDIESVRRRSALSGTMRRRGVDPRRVCGVEVDWSANGFA